jgi:hypothetical protein
MSLHKEPDAIALIADAQLQAQLAFYHAPSAISEAELAHFLESIEDSAVNLQTPQKPDLKATMAIQFHQN